MESKIEAYRKELKETVNNIEDDRSRDLLRMYLLGDMPLTFMSLITGLPKESMRFHMTRGLRTLGIDASPKDYKDGVIRKYISKYSLDK